MSIYQIYHAFTVKKFLYFVLLSMIAVFDETKDKWDVINHIRTIRVKHYLCCMPALFPGCTNNRSTTKHINLLPARACLPAAALYTADGPSEAHPGSLGSS